MTFYDLAYRLLLALGAPALWARPALRAKLARALRERDGGVAARTGNGPCVLVHAVSVGEVNATREMVGKLIGAERRSDGETTRRSGAEAELHVVLSVTTDTGFERARQLFGGPAHAGRYTLSIGLWSRGLSIGWSRFVGIGGLIGASAVMATMVRPLTTSR